MGERVFVFGTIRREQPRHYLLGNAKFIDYATLEGFELYYIYNMFPGIVEGDGKVIGEVYELPEDDLYKLDEAEDAISIKNVEIGLSRRIKVKVKTQSGQILDAWCYVFIQDIENSTKIPSGDWVEFSKSISQ